MTKPALLWSPDSHDYVWSPDGPECHVCGFVHTKDLTVDVYDQALFEGLMSELDEQMTKILTNKVVKS